MGVLGLAGTAPPLRARQGAKPVVVLLAPRDQPEVTQRTIRAVWAQLSDVRVDLRVERVASVPAAAGEQLQLARRFAGGSGTLSVFWYDPRRQALCILLRASAGDRLVVRPVGAAGSEGRFEAMGLILRTTVLAHRKGRDVGTPLPPPRRVSPPAARRRMVPRRCHTRHCPSPRRRWVALDVAGALDLIGDRRVAAGLRIGVVVHLHRQWSVFAGYRMEAPVEHGVTGVATLQLWRHPVELGARFLWSSGRLSLGARLALGLVVLHRRFIWVEDDYVGLPGGPDLQLTITPTVVVALRLVRGARLVMDIGARVVVGNKAYLARTSEPGETVPLLSPWPVQPQARLGLEVDLF